MLYGKNLFMLAPVQSLLFLGYPVPFKNTSSKRIFFLYFNDIIVALPAFTSSGLLVSNTTILDHCIQFQILLSCLFLIIVIRSSVQPSSNNFLSRLSTTRNYEINDNNSPLRASPFQRFENYCWTAQISWSISNLS